MALLCNCCVNHKQQISRGFSDGLCRGLALPLLSAQNYDEFSDFQWLVVEFYVDFNVVLCFTYPV